MKTSYMHIVIGLKLSLLCLMVGIVIWYYHNFSPPLFLFVSGRFQILSGSTLAAVKLKS